MRNCYKFIFLFLLISFTATAQVNVTGHITSIPDQTNAYARITFTNVLTLADYVTLTNPANGNFIISIPSANYNVKVEVQYHFLYEDDNVAISSDTNFDLQMIEDLGKETTVYSTILEVAKVLTATRDGSPNTMMERWHDSDQPIKFYARNNDPGDPYSMPLGYREFLESAINDITTKSGGEVTFSEQSSPVDVGINFIYVFANEMPLPGLGYTEIEEYYPDNSPKKVKIHINKNNLSSSQKNGIFRREFMRALRTYDDSSDPNYIMSFVSQATSLHNDEGKVLQIMYTLKNGTDMSKHKYTIITTPVPVELTSFNAKIKDNIVNLVWNTATEVNNYGFDIERKKDSWEKIGFMPGHGNSNSPKDYEFADTLKLEGKYSYRLKQVDNDGTSEYGPVINIDLNNFVKEYLITQNYPNPFNPETNIQFKIPETSKVKLTVYDILGRELETLIDETLEPGIYTEIFNAKDKASGTYFYHIQAGSYTESRSMLLMK